MADRTRDELIAILGAKVARSITSASGDGRTVERPIEAARYVVNMLTVHEPELLAGLAVTFARAQVGEHFVHALVASPPHRDRTDEHGGVDQSGPGVSGDDEQVSSGTVGPESSPAAMTTTTSTTTASDAGAR